MDIELVVKSLTESACTISEESGDYAPNEKGGAKNSRADGTRTHNLPLRRRAPYPLGHGPNLHTLPLFRPKCPLALLTPAELYKVWKAYSLLGQRKFVWKNNISLTIICFLTTTNYFNNFNKKFILAAKFYIIDSFLSGKEVLVSVY